ncbi:MAG: dihydrodipicolinate synthase family protein [Pseudomonadota bacterium]
MAAGTAGRAKRGIYAAAITPLGADGQPDAAKLAAYCRWLIEAGLDGVAPFGTTGEGNSLPLAFRCAAPEVLAAQGIAGDQAILGTGACATDDAVAATRAALDAGFCNTLVLPPFYYKGVSDEGLYSHYARLIDRIGDARLRVYFYHFPAMSAVPISVDLVTRLRDAYGVIIAGLKDSSGDLENALSYVRAVPEFDVFPSNEGVLIEATQQGCAGIISATTNVAPMLCRQAREAEGAAQEALVARLRAIRGAVSKHSLMAAVKAIQARRSEDAGWAAVLPPLVPLSAAAAVQLWSDLAPHLEEIGI